MNRSPALSIAGPLARMTRFDLICAVIVVLEADR